MVCEERNLAECCFRKLKHLRRVATRHEKAGHNYPALLLLAATTLWLSSMSPELVAVTLWKASSRDTWRQQGLEQKRAFFAATVLGQGTAPQADDPARAIPRRTAPK